MDNSQDYNQLFTDAGQQYGVDPALLIAQAKAESNLNPNAVGPETPYGRAQGISQLIPDTARRLGVTNPKDPKQAIPAQAKLMAENIQRYGDPQTALLAYHGGTNKANWGPKTKAYAEKIMGEYKPVEIAQNATQPEKILPGNTGSSVNDDDLDPFEGAKKDLAARAAGATQPTTPEDEEDPFEGAKKDVAHKNAVQESMAKASSREAGPEWLQNIGKATDELGSHMTPGKMAAIVPSLAIAPAMEAVAGAAGTVPYLGAAARTLAGTAPQGANALTQLGVRGISGAAQGAGANALMGGDVQEGAETGAVLNPALGVAGKVAAPVFNAVTGYGSKIAPEIAELAKNASQKYGVNIPGGLLSDNPLVKRSYSMLDRFGMIPKDDNMNNFTRAVSKTMGGDTNKLTREAMKGVKDNISNMYDEVASSTPHIKLDNTLLNQLTKVEQSSNDTLIPVGDARIQKQIDKLINVAAANNGNIPISVWRDATDSGSVLKKLAKEGGTVGQHASELRNALYDSLKNNIPKDQVDKLNKANRFYKNYKTVQTVAEKDPVTGEINPLSIANQVNKTTRKFGNGGVDDLQELGDIGRNFALTPSSGTAENYLMAKGASLLGQGIVGGAGYMAGGIPAGVGAYLAGKAGGKYLNSAGYRDRLINSAMGNNSMMELLNHNPALSNAIITGNRLVK